MEQHPEGKRPVKGLSIPLSSHVIVLLQMVGVALCLYPIWDVERLSPGAVALVIGAGGLLLGTLYANRPGNFAVYPELIPGARIVKHGPYRWIRHPMYASLLLFVLGFCLQNRNPVNLLGLLITLVGLFVKIRREEAYLHAADPDYAAYVRRTWRLIPFIW